MENYKGWEIEVYTRQEDDYRIYFHATAPERTVPQMHLSVFEDLLELYWDDGDCLMSVPGYDKPVNLYIELNSVELTPSLYCWIGSEHDTKHPDSFDWISTPEDVTEYVKSAIDKIDAAMMDPSVSLYVEAARKRRKEEKRSRARRAELIRGILETLAKEGSCQVIVTAESVLVPDIPGKGYMDKSFDMIVPVSAGKSLFCQIDHYLRCCGLNRVGLVGLR